MKALASAAALALAAFAIWRFRRRGTRTVIAGRFTTNAVRAAALLLFLLEGGDRAEAADATPRPAPADGLTRIGTPSATPIESKATFGGALPALLAGEGLRRWARKNDDWALKEAIKLLSAWESEREPARRESSAKDLLARATALPPEMREVIAAALAGETQPTKASQSLAALEALETEAIWNGSLAAWLWRRTAMPEDPTELPVLYARVETHLRTLDVLTKTSAITGPVRHTPWMSKAMRPIDHVGAVDVPADFEKTAAKLFPETPAGTWETDAAIGFTASAAATLHRRGEKLAIAKGDFVRLRRLDVLEAGTAVTLEHATLGKIVVPAGTLVTAWSLPPLLSGDATRYVEKEVTSALAGDAGARKRLETVLPAAHPAIRAALAAKPEAAGAPALRQVLATFDE